MSKLLKKLRGVKEPRSLADIQAEYSDVSSKAAQANYQAFVYAEEGQRLHKLMQVLNKEANERNRLDAEAAKAVKEAKDKNEKS